MKRLAALLLSLLLVATPAWASIAVDAVSTGNYDGSSAPFEFSWSHTCTGCDYLSVCVAHTSGATVVSVVFGAQGLTLVDTNLGTTNGAEVWELKAPISGTDTILVTMTASVNAAAGATSYTGIDQTTPYGTVVNADDLGGNITADITVAADGLATDCLYTSNDSTPIVGAGQNQRFNLTSPTPNVTVAGSTEAATGTVTMSWSSMAAELGKLIAVPLNAAAVAPPGSDFFSRRR